MLPQYAVSPNFLEAGKWTGTKSHILALKTGKDVQTTEPLYCIVVGTILDDKSFLAKHGNFSPRFSDDARKAKLQFTLACPEDPDFALDFEKSVVAFDTLQDNISASTLQQYFLSKDDGNTLRMNYSLFEPKVSMTRLYSSHLICIMSFFSI